MMLLRSWKPDNAKRVCVEEYVSIEFRFYYNHVAICKNAKSEVLTSKQCKWHKIYSNIIKGGCSHGDYNSVCLPHWGGNPEDQIQTKHRCLFEPFLKPFKKKYFLCQFKHQHVKTECCLFDVAFNSVPTPRSVVHPSYPATACK